MPMFSLKLKKSTIPFAVMCRVFVLGSMLVFFMLTTVGCASVNYVGDAFSPTSDVEIFYSEDAIEREYDLIGHGLGSGFWVRNRKIQAKLIDEAKDQGADAILVTGLGKSNIMVANQVSLNEKQMNVVFLRYR